MPIDPTTGEEQINPLESMIESTILQNESMKEQGQETNALLEAIVLQGNSVEPLLEAQIIQSQKNNKELKEALKESTFNFQIDGVEMASITGPQGEKGEKGDKGDDGAVSLEMPDGTIERKEGKIVVKGLKGDKGDKGEQGEKGESGKDGVDGKVIFGANGRNGLDGIDGKDGVDGANGRDGSPDTPKQIKKKLESLKDDERLDVKAIKGIKDFQKQLDRVAGFASQGQEYRISGTKIANNSGVLNFVAGSGATITGVPTSDGATITIGASGGGGAVDSVNGQTGVVVLDTGDIAEATDANYVSDAQLVVIGNTSGTNTGDQNLSGYELLSNKSTSTSLGTSDTLYPTQNAVKTYADNLIVGLLDYRGAYDASVNTFPTSGGSGTAGAVLKGDLWIISVAGTLGGTAVQIGDSVIANVDTPGQTAGNWNVLNGNISYVPEDVANKENTTIDTSTTKYPTVNLLKTGLDAKVPYTGATGDVNIGTYGLTAHNIKGDASDGLLIEANNGTDVGILGAGNTANATWYGSHNIEGTQVAIGKNATTLGKLKLYGNTSGDVTIQPNAVAGTGVVLTAPATTGTIALTSDIPAAGANTALSNLASVAINTSLVSDTTNTDDLGSSSILWRHTYTTDVELGHASDTTLSRVSAGVVAVEGVRVITSSGTTTGTILKNNGTTFVASTETYATPGTSGNVMTSDGTNWTSSAPTSSGENFRNVVSWGSANDGMLTSIGTGGSITRVPAHTIINGGNAGNSSILYGDLSTSNAFTNDWDNTMELHFTAIVIGTSNAYHMAGFWKSGDSLPEGSTWVNQHALFFYDGTILYASNGNGSTQTKTSLGTTITTAHDYAIKFRVDSGEIDFLVDGSVVATHTTNLPSGAADSTIRYGFRAGAGSSNQRFTIRNGYVVKVDAD